MKTFSTLLAASLALSTSTIAAAAPCPTTPAVKRALCQLRQGSFDERYEACRALRRMKGKAREAAIPLLVRLLRHGRPVPKRVPHIPPRDLRWQAAYALQSMGAASVAPLLGALKSRHAYARQAAAQTLGYLPADKRVVAALVKALRDPNSRVRALAARSLGRKGQLTGKRAVKALIAATKTRHREALEAAVVALGKIAEGKVAQKRPVELPGASVGCLRRALRHSHPRVQISAAEALRPFGRHGAAAVPELIKALSYKSDLAKREAILTLRFLGKRATAAIPRLKALLAHRNPRVRGDAEWALKSIGSR